MEYTLLSKLTAKELVMSVNAYLEIGWELYGDPFHAYCSEGSKYCQAMVRDKTRN